MSEDRHTLLAGASSPRRARDDDAPQLSRLFAAAFHSDPLINWIARSGPRRAEGLERFFYWVLKVRGLPFGDVWMSEDANACAAWLPPGTPASPGGFVDQMRLMPLLVRLCGLPRLARAVAVAEAMEKNHPKQRHFYLAFIAVAPRLQGQGLGGAILEATLKRTDAIGAPAYLENSNPRNTPLYERYGFVTQKNIAPKGAPAMLAMSRKARPGQDQGSSSLSQ